MCRQLLIVLFLVTPAACDSVGPKDNEQPAIPVVIELLIPEMYVNGQPDLRAEAGSIIRDIQAKVSDGSGNAVPGARILWEVTDGHVPTPEVGTVEGIGRSIGWTQWTLGSRVGTQEITARLVGDAESKFTGAALPLRILASPAAASITVPDTIRFTAQRQSRTLNPMVRGGDGAELSVYRLRLELVGPALVAARVDSVNAARDAGPTVVSNQPGTEGVTRLRVWSVVNPEVADTAVLLVEYVPAMVGETGDGWTDRTFVPAEVKGLRINVQDSSGYAIPGSGGVTVTSSDPSVLAVSGDTLVALTVGTATITATWQGTDWLSRTYEVFPVLDLGAPSSAIVAPQNSLCPGLMGLRAADGVAVAWRGDCFGGGSSIGAWIASRWGEFAWSSAWDFATYGAFNDAVVGPDNTTYVAAGSASSTTVVATAADGAERWRTSFSAVATSGPIRLALSPSGTLFISYPQAVVAVRNGVVQWNVATTGAVGVVAVGDSLYTLHTDRVELRRADGVVAWTRALPAAAVRSAVRADGSLYVVLASGSLAALSADGIIEWTSPVPSTTSVPSNAMIVIDAQGDALAVSNGTDALWTSTVTSFAPDGTVRWRRDVRTHYHTPIVATNGHLYLTGSFGNVFALDAATGVSVGRTRAPESSSSFPGRSTLLLPGILATLDGYNLERYTVPFGPVSGWSQQSGTAGRTNARFVP
ncbi:MAG: PQQ-binding-like beta-propeller repeat protein [Gemmatimonadaceae bacterium]